MLKRDYGQEMAETAKAGLLFLMAPDELQGTVLEHADRPREYRQIKEKMVMLLDARGQLKDPNAMDIGYSGEEDRTWETELGDFDAGAVGRSDHCYRCGGMGRIANECPTPKGKGKGKVDRNFYAKGTKGHEKGKGKSAGGKGHDKGKGKGSMVCAHCGKRGHDTSRCWTLHPEQLPWKSTNVVEENYYHQCDHADNNGMSVWSVDYDFVPWVTVTPRCCSKRNVFPTPPGLKVNNRFDVFSETWDVGGLEVLIPEKAIAGVGKAERLKSAGRGKVTIDSGAADSVMPRGMLEGEPLVEGEAKRLGVKYVAASGAKMDNYGQKRIRFKKEGLSGVSDMLFQVTDVGGSWTKEIPLSFR